MGLFAPAPSKVIRRVLQGGRRIHQARSSRQVMAWSRRAIEPLGETMADHDVNGGLGERFDNLRSKEIGRFRSIWLLVPESKRPDFMGMMDTPRWSNHSRSTSITAPRVHFRRSSI